MIPTPFSLVQVVVFRLPATFNSQATDGGVNSNTSHSACTDAHTLSAHHIALIPCTTSVAQGQPDCVAKIFVSFHFSRAMSLAPHRTPSTLSSTFSSVPGLQRLLTSRISCADPRERGGDGYTDPEPLTQHTKHSQGPKWIGQHWPPRRSGPACMDWPKWHWPKPFMTLLFFPISFKRFGTMISVLRHGPCSSGHIESGLHVCSDFVFIPLPICDLLVAVSVESQISQSLTDLPTIYCHTFR